MDTETEAEKQERHNTYLNELAEQDRWLPINNVARLMKNTLPATTKVSKDAKECMQECVSEFISFVTSEACDRCTSGKRKTINGEDILISLHALGFENYAEVLKIYLAKYRQQQAIKNQMMYSRDETAANEHAGNDDMDSGIRGVSGDVDPGQGHVIQETGASASLGNNNGSEEGAKAQSQAQAQTQNNGPSIAESPVQPNIVVQEPLGSRHSMHGTSL